MNDRKARARQIAKFRGIYERALYEIENGTWNLPYWEERSDWSKARLEILFAEQRRLYSGDLNHVSVALDEWLADIASAYGEDSEPPPHAA